MPTHSLFANKLMPHLFLTQPIITPAKIFSSHFRYNSTCIHSDENLIIKFFKKIKNKNLIIKVPLPFQNRSLFYQSSSNQQPLSLRFDWRQNHSNISIFLKLHCVSVTFVKNVFPRRDSNNSRYKFPLRWIPESQV